MNSERSIVAISPRTLHCGLLGLGAAAALLAGWPQPASAWFAPPEEPVISHDVKMEFPDGTVAPELRFRYRVYAYAQTNGCKSEPGQLVSSTAGIPIGLGYLDKKRDAVAPNSEAHAKADVNVTKLEATKAEFIYTADCSAYASIHGCPDPPPPNSMGYANSEAYSHVLIKASAKEKKGKIDVVGKWQDMGRVGPGKQRAVAKDPIVARLIDHTNGITTEYVLLTVLGSARNGYMSWDNGVFTNNAGELSFDMKIESPVTLQQGRLKLVVENGVVSESITTGMFAGMGFPAAGMSGTFSAPLGDITLDFDLGGDDTHIEETEFEFDTGVAAEAAENGIDSGGSLINDIGVGFDYSNVSRIPQGDTSLGFPTNHVANRIAERFTIAPGTQAHLNSLRWPTYQIGTDPLLGIAAAYVRVWQGNPMTGGIPVAGDMTTNRLAETRFSGAYRVGAVATSTARAIKDVIIDMQWVQPLNAGEYWIEVGLESMDGMTLWTPAAVWASDSDSAIHYNAIANTWSELRDVGSQRRVSMPFTVFGGLLPVPVSCPTDIAPDGLGDGTTNVADLLMVINRWGQPGGPADINHNGIVNVGDLLAVINGWGLCLN